MVIYRTFDKVLVQSAIETYAETIIGLALPEWLSLEDNVALANSSGDAALFERQDYSPTTVCGHYFFHSRGKTAISAAKAFLKEIFTGPYNVLTIIGLTPVDHKAALWMTRHLGFKFYGQIDTETGLNEFSLLTKQEWLQQEGNTQ